MDQIKIGKFIAEMRKERNLTQIDLANILGVSNKTVSKWECGNSMPDYAVVEKLCEVLEINLNELLSGERLPGKDYNKKAEENMISLMQESSENKKTAVKEIFITILGVVGVLGVVILMIISWGGIAALGDFYDMPTIIYVVLTSFMILVISGLWKDFLKGFKIAWGNQMVTNTSQIKKSMLAIKTEMIALLMSAVLMMGIAFVEILRRLDDLEDIGRWISVAFLSVFYGVLFMLCLLPVYVRVKKKLLDE